MLNQIIKNIGLLLVFSLLPGLYSTSLLQNQLINENSSSDASGLWPNITSDFRLNEELSHKSVQSQIRWFASNPAYIKLLTHNSRPYVYYIDQQLKERGLPAELTLLPMIESDYKPFLHSKSGAVGLWQMMPFIATDLGISSHWWDDQRTNVLASTNAALTQLNYLHRTFHDWLLAFAAYNAGEDAVKAAIHYNKEHNKPTDFWSLKLPKETEEYVPKLLALAAVFKDPAKYHVTLLPVANRPVFKVV